MAAVSEWMTDLAASVSKGGHLQHVDGFHEAPITDVHWWLAFVLEMVSQRCQHTDYVIGHRHLSHRSFCRTPAIHTALSVPQGSKPGTEEG